ncbi:hypothetical protein ACMXYX_18110 (plasmid) [Neptuniibacter sp. QD72_48]|uniref:hypothetical protein n=1 Tax=Neptuniibacter sp. QD72_48 TaxID=3398214 RepID=UPI0039F58363
MTKTTQLLRPKDLTPAKAPFENNEIKVVDSWDREPVLSLDVELSAKFNNVPVELFAAHSRREESKRNVQDLADKVQARSIASNPVQKTELDLNAYSVKQKKERAARIDRAFAQFGVSYDFNSMQIKQGANLEFEFLRKYITDADDRMMMIQKFNHYAGDSSNFVRFKLVDGSVLSGFVLNQLNKVGLLPLFKHYGFMECLHLAQHGDVILKDGHKIDLVKDIREAITLAKDDITVMSDEEQMDFAQRFNMPSIFADNHERKAVYELLEKWEENLFNVINDSLIKAPKSEKTANYNDYAL